MPIGLISHVLEYFFPKIKYVSDGRLVAFFFTKTFWVCTSPSAVKSEKRNYKKKIMLNHIPHMANPKRNSQ